MSHFDNDPTPVTDPETEPTIALEEPSASRRVVSSHVEDDDETMVSFPPVDGLPATPSPAQGSQPRIPSIRPPRPGTGPEPALREEQLFDDLSLESIAPPPPLLIQPRVRATRARIKSSARQAGPPLSEILPLVASFLAGAAVATAVFLVVGHLRADREPTEQPRSTPSVSPEGPGKRAVAVKPRPAPPRRTSAREREAKPLVAPDAPRVKADPPKVEPRPAPDPDPPAIGAGKQLARAVLPCELRPGGQTLRLAVYLDPPGEVRRVFMARRSWLGRAERRCVERRLIGTELNGFTVRGYVEWHLWLGPGEVSAELLRQRRR